GALPARIALAPRRAADGGRRLEGVVGTRAARPGAQLVEVAVARRGATDRAGVPRCMLAEVARAVAGVAGARVAVVGAERAARFLGIRPACLTRQATAALGDVALAGRRPADDPDRQEHIGRTRGAHAGAHLVGITGVAGACPADGAGIAGRVLAGAVRAVAQVGRADVAVVAARRPRRALGVGRAARPGAGARLRRIALARRGAADDEARLEHVGGTRAARARAGLVNVAGTGRSPAHRARVARRVLAGVAGPVARVRRAGVAVIGAGRAVGLLGVGGARGAAADAEVVEVAVV